MADLSKIPLVALSIDTKILVSTLLNPTKWLPTDDGLPRDWRGLAHLCDLDGQTIPSLTSHSDPTKEILTIMGNRMPCPTFADFQLILGRIDRWDIIDDACTLFERDAEKYLERLARCIPVEEIDMDDDVDALTIDDSYGIGQSLYKQRYDAFLLYSEEDMEFVTEMINNLEKKRNLKAFTTTKTVTFFMKNHGRNPTHDCTPWLALVFNISRIQLCIKDRDLIGGVTFEHEAVMRLISERCNRLIVVVSPNFLKSSANKFFLNYAQAVGIEMRQRKMIPCLYKKCELPPQLKYTFTLDYSKDGLYDFWGRLSNSVKAAVKNSSNSNLPMHQMSQPSSDEKKMIECKKEEGSKSSLNVATCPDLIENSHKELIGAVSVASSPKELVKRTKTKIGVPWPKRKRDKTPKKNVQQIEPVTETISISISLPSLDNLPSLDIMESTGNKSTKQKKNLVGTCVKKVQSLLSKS